MSNYNTSNFIYIFSLILLIMHFCVALFSMIPMAKLGVYNDGFCVLKSLRSKEGKRWIYITQYTYNHLINGNRMRDFYDMIFAMDDTVDFNNIIIANVVIFEAQRLYDMQEYEKSFEQYSRLDVKKLPIYLQGQVYNDLIYYYIIHNHDYEQARKIFNDKKVKKYFNLRVLCAYECFVNEDKIQCSKYMKKIEKTIALLSKRRDGGSIMEKEYLTHLIELIEKPVKQN